MSDAAPCCEACTREARDLASGKISAASPVRLKPPTQFYFETSALVPWETPAADDLGGVWLRKLKPCDHIVGVYAAILDGAGDPVIATAKIDVFMLRRSSQRELSNRNAGTHGLLYRENMRSFRGGVEYASTSPREIYVDNFGKGWGVGADWRSVDGRDTPQAPVLMILYRKLAAAGSSFQCMVEYQSCNK